ncbi:hypothetical protein WAI453_010572 [Rhynchosporium graminicola]
MRLFSGPGSGTVGPQDSEGIKGNLSSLETQTKEPDNGTNETWTAEPRVLPSASFIPKNWSSLLNHSSPGSMEDTSG